MNTCKYCGKNDDKNHGCCECVESCGKCLYTKCKFCSSVRCILCHLEWSNDDNIHLRHLEHGYGRCVTNCVDCELDGEERCFCGDEEYDSASELPNNTRTKFEARMQSAIINADAKGIPLERTNTGGVQLSTKTFESPRGIEYRTYRDYLIGTGQWITELTIT